MKVKVFRINIDLGLEDPGSFILSHMSEDDRVDFVETISPIPDISQLRDALEMFLKDDDKVIDGIHESNAKDSCSVYFYFHDKENETENEIKLVFSIRVSDHSTTRKGDTNKSNTARHKNYLNKYGIDDVYKDTGKAVKQWKYKKYTLDDYEIKDLSEAFDHITYYITHHM